MTVFDVFDLCVEHVDVKTGVSRNFDDILNVSKKGRFFEDVEKDCKKTEQRFRSNLVSCRCAGEERESWGEMRFGIVLCSSRRE